MKFYLDFFYKKKILSFPILYVLVGFSFVEPIVAQVGPLRIHPDRIERFWQLPLSKQVYRVPNISLSSSVKDLIDTPTQIYQEDSLYFLQNTVLCLKFKLVNLSNKDSLRLFVTFPPVNKAELFYEVSKDKWDILRPTDIIRYKGIQPSPDYSSIFISLASRQSTTFYLRLSNLKFKSDRNKIPIQLVSELAGMNISQRGNLSREGIKVFYSFFMGILAILFLLTQIYFLVHRDKAYLYYSLYLGCLFLFFLKNLESASLPFLIEWSRKLENPISYLSFIFYMQFIREFLKLYEVSEILNKVIQYCSRFFIVLFLVDLVVRVILPKLYSAQFFPIFYSFFFVLCFVFVLVLWRKLTSVPSRLVLLGTVIMILPVAIMRIADASSVSYDSLAWGTMRVFYLKSAKFYFLHTKAGILCEVICFIVALVWRTYQEEQEFANLRKALKSQHLSQREKNDLNLVGEIQDAFLEKISSIIEAHYQDSEFGPLQLAKKLHLSYSHCANTVKKKTNLSLSSYIQQFRLKKAQELLLTTKGTVREIAFEVGFNDPAYFTRRFKKLLEMSPSQYRKEFQKPK